MRGCSTWIRAVHFHETEMAVIIDQKLSYGAGFIRVADLLGPAQLDRAPRPVFSPEARARHQRRRAFLHDLLIATLDRAVALPGGAPTRGRARRRKTLKLDVMGIDDETFDVDLGIAEGSCPLPGGPRGSPARGFVSLPRHPQLPRSSFHAPGHRLDQRREIPAFRAIFDRLTPRCRPSRRCPEARTAALRPQSRCQSEPVPHQPDGARWQDQ